MKRANRIRKRWLWWILPVMTVVALAGLRWANRRIERSPNEIATKIPLPIEIVTFNAHLLPPVANRIVGRRGQGVYRIRAIAKRLKQVDVVGLCEVFDERLADSLIDEFTVGDQPSFTFVRSPPPASLTRWTSGGLLLLSRLPVTEHHHLMFSQGSRLLTTGFKSGDGLAAKGAIHARLKVADRDVSEIDCFLTHLDSYSASVRANQLQELVQFIRAHRAVQNPFLVMGDFNIVGSVDAGRPGDREYRRLIECLELEELSLIDTQLVDGRIASGTSDALANNGGSRIDYIFFGWPTTMADRWATTGATFPFLDDKVAAGSVSDHAAIRCRLEKPVSKIEANGK